MTMTAWEQGRKGSLAGSMTASSLSRSLARSVAQSEKKRKEKRRRKIGLSLEELAVIQALKGLTLSPYAI